MVFFGVLVLRSLGGSIDRPPAPPPPPPSALDPSERDERGREVRELGLARYPESTPIERATTHRFDALRAPHRVAYALDALPYRETEADFRGLGEELGFARSPAGFTYVPTKSCPDALVCAWRFLGRRNAEDVRALAARFVRHARADRLSSREAAQLVIAFVQAIPYERNDDWLFGLLPPNAVAWERRGDCDSKAMLAILLLHELGIDAVMLSSDAHGHAVVGVDLPYGRSQLTFEGRRYAMTEVTAYGWPLGELPPSVRHPDDWTPTRVIARPR